MLSSIATLSYQLDLTILHLFAQWNGQTVLFDPLKERYQVLPLNLGVMEKKWYLTFPEAIEMKPNHDMV